MLLTQIEFILLLPVLLCCLILVTSGLHRKSIILGFSYFFYAWWDWRFLWLLLIPTFLDHHLARRIEESRDPSVRKLLLAISLGVNLGILCLFKYFGFFVQSLQNFLAPLGMHLQSLEIVLPLGISFTTFKTLSYVIDVYRGTAPACRSLLDYALYVSFFPTLLAGPIIRAPRFLSQLKGDVKPSKEGMLAGSRLFIIGLFKKVFIADRLALFVDPFFASSGAFDSATTWLAVAAYSLQLYLDFSGYSDMAIGTARMLGYEIEENFNFPYLAGSIREFWRRWHMSLSSWIRDYVYIPLGGSRKGEARSQVNLFTAMVLCGLWHGTGWTFAVWGAYHGAALAANRLFDRFVKRTPLPQRPLETLVGVLLTLLTVMIGWVLFRSADLHQASMIIRSLFVPTGGVSWPYPFAIAACGAAVLYHLVEALGFTRVHQLPLAARYTPALLFSMLWLIVLFRPEGFNPFAYARF